MCIRDRSRCAILRYSKLSDEQVLKRLLEIIKAEDVQYTNDGLEAIIFTAEGDMRQAINNLQSTVAGHGLVNGENVFKIVDSPHPLIVKKMLLAETLDESIDCLRQELWAKGYSAVDIVTTCFRVTKNLFQLKESVRLEMIKEIGTTHMRILEGVSTYLQLASMLAKIHKLKA